MMSRNPPLRGGFRDIIKKAPALRAGAWEVGGKIPKVDAYGRWKD